MEERKKEEETKRNKYSVNKIKHRKIRDRGKRVCTRDLYKFRITTKPTPVPKTFLLRVPLKM